MDREGGHKERMRKCREWVSLHFLILSPFPYSISISSFSLHFLAAQVQRVAQPCKDAQLKILVILSLALRRIPEDFYSWIWWICSHRCSDCSISFHAHYRPIHTEDEEDRISPSSTSSSKLSQWLTSIVPPVKNPPWWGFDSYDKSWGFVTGGFIKFF